VKSISSRNCHDTWHETHAPLAPPELIRIRNLAGFRDRLRAAFPDVYVVGSVDAPLGFCILRGDELYQLFVSPEARGAGVAAALISDAEVRLARRGVETIWLACALGNHRAARFYEKSGWHRTGAVVLPMETPNGPFPVEHWRYEKQLMRST
jgi:GNAT superfamily N-acetyltransferase